jgi:hypothetical protein
MATWTQHTAGSLRALSNARQGMGYQISASSSLVGKEITSVTFWLNYNGSANTGTTPINCVARNSSGTLQTTIGSMTENQVQETTTSHNFSGSNHTVSSGDIIAIEFNSTNGIQTPVDITSSNSTYSPQSALHATSDTTNYISTGDGGNHYHIKITIEYQDASGGGSGGGDGSSDGSISGTGGPSPSYAMKLNIGYIR